MWLLVVPILVGFDMPPPLPPVRLDHQGAPRRADSVASWSPPVGWTWLREDDPLERRSNWTGVTLNAPFIQFPPLTMARMDEDGRTLGRCRIVVFGKNIYII